MNFLFRYANPHEFLRLSGKVLPFSAAGAVICLATGLYLGFSAPPDYQQGRTVLIMFVHVPAATMAMAVYGAIAVCSFFSLIWRHPLSDIAARSAAPLGALFTVLGLITGSLWGKPMWGTYWAWDPRMTSFLLLLFIYAGYMILWNAIDDEPRAAKVAAMLALVGAVNIPIIKFSVEWWNSLHQGESIISGKLAPVFLAPLLLMIFGYGLLFLSLWLVRIRTVILERRIRSLMQDN
jgi:heme exporter protein C